MRSGAHGILDKANKAERKELRLSMVNGAARIAEKKLKERQKERTKERKKDSLYG